MQDEMPNIEDMTQEQKIDEILITLRQVGMVLRQFQGMKPTDMIKLVLGGGK